MTNIKWRPKPPYSHCLVVAMAGCPLSVLYAVVCSIHFSQPPNLYLIHVHRQEPTCILLIMMRWGSKWEGIVPYMTILIIVSVLIGSFYCHMISPWSCQAVAIHSGKPFSWIADDGIEPSISFVMVSRSRCKKIKFNTNLT